MLQLTMKASGMETTQYSAPPLLVLAFLFSHDIGSSEHDVEMLQALFLIINQNKLHRETSVH